jgi:hypothetical protein
MLRVILVLTFSVCFLLTATAQKSVEGEKKAYPAVFQIGQLPTAFEILSGDYETALLEVCDDDVKRAYAQWSMMLRAMENHAKVKGYNLKGVKMWLKVFWNEDGSIEHIAFHLKPGSKNVNTDILTSFLQGFMKTYQAGFKAEEPFSQYSSASFPTLPQLVFD